MRVDWRRITAPAIEPFTLTQARAQCQIDWTDDDARLDQAIASARWHIEDRIGRGLLTQTWQQVQDGWAETWWLGGAAPLQSVTKVEYYDRTGTLQTLSTSLYIVHDEGEPGWIDRAPNAVLPPLQVGRSGRVITTYVTGWTRAALVPAPLIQALALLVRHFYDNPSAVVVDTGRAVVIEVPMGVDALIGSYYLNWRAPECGFY